jgi:transposase
MQSQIRSLLKDGHSIRMVARSLGISRQSVRKFMCGDAEGEAEGKQEEKAWYEKFDWVLVVDAYAKGVTAKQLHAEYAPEQKYWTFWRQLANRAEAKPAVVLRIVHQPGERAELDYADGIAIVDARTGAKTKTHLFCAVLPFSSYTFGEFVLNQKLPSFIASQERMWRYFGGVTSYVVIDNLKAGVSKAHRYDPDLNPTYCDYSNHTGFAVLPARPYKPRDKATIEATIGAIQRGFYQEVREQVFYSLATLNAEFGEYLTRFNNAVMKDYGRSRSARFEVERALLKPLPASPFEMSEWRECRVHPDCHIQVERNFYSVPYRVVSQTVRVRISGKLVEVFTTDNERLAVHPRLTQKGAFSTQEDHYPDKKLGIKRFEVKAAQKSAERIGPNTLALIESLISEQYPLRHLRRIQGILRLVDSKHVTSSGLEYAAKQAMLFKKPRLAYIKSCAEHFDGNGTKLALVSPARSPEDLFLHGLKAGGEA